ncbi:MAG: hypothetical protein COB98_05495 [Flavobacteriaceae bacterium]|nr:MAG: hypothetical protein COB98_05495 [Flavobacteriaceae bacterium]
MKTIKNILGVICIAAALSGCLKNDNDDLPVSPQADGEALLERFLKNRTDAVENFEIDAASGGMITGSQGTTVYFPANAFGLNGTPVTGTISVALLEIYNKADMLLKDNSTLGKHANGDKEILQSAGEFFINGTQGNLQLELLAQATVTSRPIDLEDFDGQMNIFKKGTATDKCDGIDADCDWIEADENDDGKVDKANIIDDENGKIISYRYLIGSFGWTNLDRWYSYAGPKTRIYVDVPEGFDSSNCAVYLSYDGEPSALASMDTYNTELDLFTEHYGMIPIGQKIHIIVVAEIDGVLHYAIQGNTVVDEHIAVITSLVPSTQAALETLINDLP